MDMEQWSLQPPTYAKCAKILCIVIETRMRGKAQRDGRPAVKWMETFTRDMGKVWMWYLIPANATETAVQARDNPRVTSANH